MVRRESRVGRKRPWGILNAPPPGRWSEILEEIPTDLGSELLLLVRAVRLAAARPAERRRGLFPSTTPRHAAERRSEALLEAPCDLRNDLRTIMRLTGRRPASDTETATACEAVAVWAQDAGYPAVAIQFAEAAAAIQTGDPYFAWVAGRTNRVVGEGWRAEVHYARAIRLAHRLQRWDVYIRAHLGMGRLLSDAGRLRVAARHFFSAGRMALDQGEEWLAAQTFHDLVPLHFELGNEEKAYVYAKKALETYPRHHERFPIAAHDFGLLLVFRRQYKEARPLLEQLTQLPLRHSEQVLVWGTLARTVGSLNDRPAFSEAEARVLSLSRQHGAFAPAAFYSLASGAHGLGDFALASQYARTALELAATREDRATIRLLQILLGDLAEGRNAAEPAPPLTGHPAIQLRELERRLQDRLPQWRAHTWTKKENQYGSMTLGTV